MKKILFVLVLVCSITLTFAQKNVRQTASNFLKDGKLDKALETINICVQDVSTAQDPKAWFIRGNVYLEIANSKDDKYKNLDPEPLQKALDSYKKAIEFDPKKDYYDDIFAKLNWQHNNYFNAGVDSYNKKSYKEAMLDFENAANTLSIAKLQDTTSLAYAAYNAGLAGEKQKQKEYYIELLKDNAKSISIYAALSDIYRSEKDSANALKVIRDGKKRYPNNLQMTLSESNVYISFNDVPKALSTLSLAAQKDSTNYLVFNAIGINYQKIYEDTLQLEANRTDAYKRSEAAYLKAIQLKSDFYDVQLNLASLYFNSAVPLALKANSLPLEQKDAYDKLVNEANGYYKLALPHLKKADELQPNDLNTLNSLRQIYSSLGDSENLKAIQAKILELRKK
jgi:tetratricopeptide (TPR) repeat protein